MSLGASTYHADSRRRTRRFRILLVGLLAAAVLYVRPFASRAAPGIGPSRPDVLFLMVDDASLYHLKYFRQLGRRLRDRSAGWHGVRFRNCYAAAPVCCPSRATLLRSQWSHGTGIFFNGESEPGAGDGGGKGFTDRGLDESTLLTWMNDGGYLVNYFGKYLNEIELSDPNRPIPGVINEHIYWRIGVGGAWNFHLRENGLINYYPRRTDADYGTDVLATKVARAIRAAQPDDPLFIVLATTAPHNPGIPAPRHANLDPNLRAPRTMSYDEQDLSDKPNWIQNMPTLDTVNPNSGITIREELDRWYRDGRRSLAAVDEAVVAILDAFDAAGRSGNTLLVVTNDNGFLYGEHRLRTKNAPHEASSRVFLVMASNNLSVIPQHMQREELVSYIDIGPTLAEVCGASIPPEHPTNGVSFAGLLHPDGEGGRTDLLIEGRTQHGEDRVGPPLYRQPSWSAIVHRDPLTGQRLKYVEYELTGEREFYDLGVDPFEMENAIDDPESAERIQALQQRLAELRAE
jgi:N-acetylglucosamine-6-sulfatase